jgi:hypothetical protein
MEIRMSAGDAGASLNALGQALLHYSSRQIGSFVSTHAKGPA